MHACIHSALKVALQGTIPGLLLLGEAGVRAEPGDKGEAGPVWDCVLRSRACLTAGGSGLPRVSLYRPAGWGHRGAVCSVGSRGQCPDTDGRLSADQAEASICQLLGIKAQSGALGALVCSLNTPYLNQKADVLWIQWPRI